MNRDVVLVTGGNSGIGFECARELARAGWHVVIASRDRRASAEARAPDHRRERRRRRFARWGSTSARPRRCGRLPGRSRRDLPASARSCCNAGLQVTTGPRLSADGYEITFAVNHLGHFLLTNLLFRRLVANAPARIVVVASGVHDPKLRTGMPKANITDIETLAATGGPRAGEFDGRLAYVNSKLCNLWFTYELVRRLEGAGFGRDGRGVTVNGFDPGLVPGSGLGRDYPAPPQVRLEHDPSRRGPRAHARRADDQPGAEVGPRARATGGRSRARSGLGEVLSVALALAGGAVVGRLLRRRAGARSLGGERPDERPRGG